MTKTVTSRYDVAEHLRTPEDMATYLEASMEEAPGDAAFIAKALGDIARAKGMSQVACDAGLSRESLYKALSGDRNPSLDTVLKVVRALGLKLHPEAALDEYTVQMGASAEPASFLRKKQWERMAGLLKHLGEACLGAELSALKEYVVPDVFGSNTRVVLLCESPHDQEVKYRLPLMGESGKVVARALERLIFQCSPEDELTEPLGRLVDRQDSRFSWLGLMNVCVVPMQAKAYGDELPAECQAFVKQLEEIREVCESKDSSCALESVIRNDLECRWMEVTSQYPGALLVPCGSVARRFCRLADISVDIRVHVDHPAFRPNRNSKLYFWDRAVNFCQTFDRIREVVERQ